LGTPEACKDGSPGLSERSERNRGDGSFIMITLGKTLARTTDILKKVFATK
jgi:hypothetical protein